jgi:uncharacterized protein YjbI with pentapeptide repeats
MKRIIVAITILFLLQISSACGRKIPVHENNKILLEQNSSICSKNVDVSVVKTEKVSPTGDVLVPGKKIRLKDGLDLSGQTICRFEMDGTNIAMSNINFSGCHFQNTQELDDIYFDHCSFHGAHLIDLRHLLQLSGNGNDFTDAEILNIGGIKMTREQLESTASFKIKSLHGIHFSESADFRGVDFSGFNLQKTNIGFHLLNGCDFTDAVIGKGSVLGDGVFGITFDQLQSTKSYKNGNLINVGLNLTWPEGHADFSGMNLTGCSFGSGGTYNHAKIDDFHEFFANSKKPEKRGWSDQCQLNLTDSVITNCNFTAFKGLTLENVKSTWNYKHNRMEGIKLSEEIQKALDAEKKKQ